MALNTGDVSALHSPAKKQGFLPEKLSMDF